MEAEGPSKHGTDSDESLLTGIIMIQGEREMWKEARQERPILLLLTTVARFITLNASESPIA